MRSPRDPAPDRATETLRGGRPRARAAGRDLSPGAAGGAWTIVRPIASGGCGAVYAARHRVLGRAAAIKLLHLELAANPAMVQRFVLEARAVNLIGHPNIVDVFDFGELADGRPYFAMELLAPDDLDRRLQLAGAFTPAEALAVLAPVGEALSAAHRAGFVHRDLKARNVGFLPLAGGGEAVKLLDFGIAKLLEPDRPGQPATQRLGTVDAMSPEQILGQPVDRRTDVYALGVLLHHLVTGQLPFEADDPLEVERMHLQAPPPPPSLTAPVSRAIDDLVAAAMAKSPADRPPDAVTFVAALRAAVERPARPLRSTLSVHLMVPDGAPLDDAALDDLETTLALARRELVGAGFEVLVAAATTLIGVAPVAPEGLAASRLPRAALDTAASIERAVAGRGLTAITSVTVDDGDACPLAAAAALEA